MPDSANDARPTAKANQQAYRVLHAEREETAAQIAALTGDFDGMVAASASSNADDEHDPEGATIAFERAQVLAVLQQAQRHAAEIDEALARLDAGTYGICTTCGGEVGVDRLAARPAARTCIRCARRT